MQNEGEYRVCTLCLKSSECALQDVETVTIEMLKILGLGLDLDVIGMAVICNTCSENLQKCFDFKTICLYTEDCINSFKKNRNNVKLDLGEIYLRKNKNENIAVPERNTICRLCMEIIEADCYMPLSGETKDVALATTILRRFFSELDLDITEDPVICTSCNDSLHTYRSFVKNRLDVEDEIKQYCESEENSNQPQVKPYSGLQFATGYAPNYKNDGTYPDIDKNCTENELCVETKLKLENVMQKEFQELHIKYEVNDHVVADDLEGETLSNLFKKCHAADQNGDTELQHEHFVETRRDEFNIKHEEIDIKADQCDLTFAHLRRNTETTVAVYSCEICTYKAKRKGYLRKHMLIHKHASEVTTYSCEMCTYKTKRKDNLKNHMLIHKTASEVTTYQCDVCTLTTRHKGDLKRHMLMHKTACEVTTYQCDVCGLKTRHKGVLRQHALLHRNASEVTMYSCEICPYKSIRKTSLRRHTLVHKVASEVTMYSCVTCTFTTKRKSNLKQHMLIHKTASEVTTYQCEVCTFKTLYKGVLKQHVLIHRNASEVTMYSCTVCTFRAKRKDHLKLHMLIHKNSSEVTTYSCGICTYKAKRRGYLNNHMLIHKNASEVATYQCDVCLFKTKRKDSLRKHLLIHKNASEVTTYSCGVCTYKANRKDSLDRHTLIHKSASRVIWYSCEICSYKAKRIGSLNRHMKNHKNSEITPM